MKHIQIWVVLFLSIWLLSSCASEQASKENSEDSADTTQVDVEESEPSEAKADWSNVGKVAESIDIYFGEQVYEKELEALPLRDGDKQWELQISNINKENIYQVSENEAYIGVEMTATGGETLIVDHLITWDATLEREEGNRGGFMVKNLVVRSVGEEVRYTWEKSGNFYEKK
ncbi:MAG: hypothetical protein JJT94_10875 [Bernardetiaceae bacterium]|nr:hypothetical protein [Bernardetiaceae bacterium]